MAVHYTGGNGLFTSLLPRMLTVAGGALGGPLGAAVGQGIGGVIGGANPLEAFGSAALGYASRSGLGSSPTPPPQLGAGTGLTNVTRWTESDEDDPWEAWLKRQNRPVDGGWR